jgi:ferredoxin-NADP reductase/Na+-translocating ferredoxin:NAD+ oxidoreductase RnfD subunit
MNLLNPIDYFLDRITMYRLVLYSLIVFLLVAVVLSLFNLIAYSPISIIESSIFLVSICVIANDVISKAFDAPTNHESVYITGLILALIISPGQTLDEFIFFFWVAVLAMASKYILAINRKHLFNPAAVSLVITGLALNKGASWWVGTTWLAPVVAICGFLIIRKLHFIDMAWTFFTTSIVTSLGVAMLKSGSIPTTLNQVIFHSSLIFLGSLMLTEPLTIPPRKEWQMVYAGIVGFLSVPQVHFGSIYFAPELALCLGNLFAYIVGSKQKLLLKLEHKIQIAPDIIDFVFRPTEKINFLPGQYMEWTLPHTKLDSRGNRRYFTLASSPTEDTLRLGVKFYPNGSNFKKTLAAIDEKSLIVASQLAGNFTLPKNKNKKLIFIAGGIGITPFRSMIKYCLDKGEKRDIVLLYSNKTREEIVYHELFFQAAKELGLKVIYTITDVIPESWQGQNRRIDSQMITELIPDYKEREFFISGPKTQIEAVKKVLSNLKIPSSQIKTDYFPGFA